METAIVLLRWAQYAASFVLMGGTLFSVYALPAHGLSSAAALGWPRRLLTGAGALLAVTSLVGLFLQTANVAGSFSAAVDPATLVSVLTEMAMGASSLARALAAMLSVVLLLGLRPGRSTWLLASALGAIATASMAWMGHGAASEGRDGVIHLSADILHLLAAAVWIGALAFFAGLAVQRPLGEDRLRDFHSALAGFSGVGSAVVATLVASGLVNSWFLVGPSGWPALATSLYGQLLVLKLAVFVAMALVAAANRFRLTPALRAGLDDPGQANAALAHLRRSLLLEFGAALTLALLVAWLGRLAPISAQ
ncbi:copper homeostasis membrane protein CopD [uncultured Caulobacter sp.]|uniref:copper homeostasis membrane protein CopD n=1 Tax=uncultured Caulobacter sp. TaxID=158749 RepID=UPI00260FA8ED|nr:copper homeostasis membrane protein CopD [uncultured Caulobacter sp.]